MTTNYLGVKSSDVDDRANLADLWNACGNGVYCVLDEEGVNVAGGQCRQLDRHHWLYVDDVDGYCVKDATDVEPLILVAEQNHAPRGWDAQGNVIDL